MSAAPMIITLLTDFGARDGYVAAMKGVILSLAPEAVIMDAGHDIPPRDVVAAAWTLGQYWRLFPPGTIHVAVVDPGVGTERAALLVEADERLFLVPDNGLLMWVLRQAERVSLKRLKLSAHRGDPSATFHGRDVFAHVAGLLASGQARAEDLSENIQEIVLPLWAMVEHTPEGLRGSIVHTDRFGNLITNISRTQALEAVGPKFMAQAGAFDAIPLRRTYGEAPPGELIVLFGSSETLELAVARGSAAERTGLKRGEPVIIRKL